MEKKDESFDDRLIIKAKMKKEDIDKIVRSLEAQIEQDNKDLSRFFEKGDFIGMAKLYEERGSVIVTHGYDKICGKHSAAYWQRVWALGAKLKFQRLLVYLTDVLGRKPVQICLKDARGRITLEDHHDNAVAFVLNEVSVIGESGRVRKLDPLDLRMYAHREDCPFR